MEQVAAIGCLHHLRIYDCMTIGRGILQESQDPVDIVLNGFRFPEHTVIKSLENVPEDLIAPSGYQKVSLMNVPRPVCLTGNRFAPDPETGSYF
jgi:hypothetical protein